MYIPYIPPGLHCFQWYCNWKPWLLKASVDVVQATGCISFVPRGGAWGQSYVVDWGGGACM